MSKKSVTGGASTGHPPSGEEAKILEVCWERLKVCLSKGQVQFRKPYSSREFLKLITEFGVIEGIELENAGRMLYKHMDKMSFAQVDYQLGAETDSSTTIRIVRTEGPWVKERVRAAEKDASMFDLDYLAPTFNSLSVALYGRPSMKPTRSHNSKVHLITK